MPIPRLSIDIELLNKDIKAVILSIIYKVKKITFQKNRKSNREPNGKLRTKILISKINISQSGLYERMELTND